MAIDFLTATPFTSCAKLKHGFFTREGGVSKGIYSSLNCALSSGDDARHVQQNRQRVAAIFGVDMLVTLAQCHSSDVLIIDNMTQAATAIGKLQADAMVTRHPNVAIGVLTADCAPILLADAEARVIGAVHAGWKGALSGIIDNTIESMVELGAKATQIVAAIGPAIAQESYQVDSIFHADFVMKNKLYEQFFIRDSERPSHYLFDLKGFVANNLRNAGVNKLTILADNTYMQESQFFSYRRAAHRKEPDYGRQISVIMLEN